MNEDIRRAYIAVASLAVGFCFGSVLMNRAMGFELKRRATLEARAFRAIANKLDEPEVTAEEALQTMNDELDFLIIALQER